MTKARKTWISQTWISQTKASPKPATARNARPAGKRPTLPLRKILAYGLSALLALQPALALAGEAVPLRADPSAALGNQPQIGAAANGVPLVNIVTPNGAGLSHNKYTDFNVGTPGVILNNFNQEVSRSQLGGLVQGNHNLATSGPAGVILNEVTGSSRSVLQGAVEVNGRAADVVIANQNGLTCNGCGFINAPRVTLSTGAPQIGAEGTLSSLRVEGGDILIGANGANASTVNVFDMVSRQISVHGPVRAGLDLNLIAGRNSYAYQSGLVTPLPSDGKEPGIAIDSSALGGMYAGRIKLIATDKGAGVNMTGPMAANTAGMTLSADGRLTLGKVQAKGAIAARSLSRSVRVESTLFSGKAIVLKGLTSVDLADNALIASSGDVSLKGETVTLGNGAVVASGTDIEGKQSASGALEIAATTLNAGNGLLAAGGLLSIAASNVDLSRATDSGQDTLRSLTDIVITADRVSAANGRVAAGRDLTIRSDNTLALDAGQFISGNTLLVEAARLTSSAYLAAVKTATLRSTGGDLVQNGEVAGNAATSVTSAADLTNSGRIVSTGHVDVTAAGNLANTGTGLVAANGNVAVTVGALGNDGTIAAQGGRLSVTARGDIANRATLTSLAGAEITSGGNLSNTGSGRLLVEDALTLRANGSLGNAGTINAGSVDLTAASLSNQGTLTSHDGALTARVANNVTNSGTVSAVGDLGLALDGTLSVTGSGQLLSQGAMTLQGRDTAAMAGLTVDPSGLINGGGSLTVRGASVTNAGEIGSANGALLAEIAGNIDNRGLLYSGTSSTYRLDGIFSNNNADVIAEGGLVIQGLSGSRAAAIANTSGTIEAVAGDMALAAGTITNQRNGATFSSDTTTEKSTSVTHPEKRLTVATTVSVDTTTETASLDGPAGQLLAGRNLTIDTGALTNRYSLIAANNDITITAGSVLNEGRDLIRTVQTTTVNRYDQKHCHNFLGIGCFYTTHERWTTTDHDTTSSTIGAVYGTIQAGGALNANVSGYLANNAVRGQAGQIGLSSGNNALGQVNVSPQSGIGAVTALDSIKTSVTALLERKAMFDAPTDPNAPYLIETRSAFVDPGKFLGSDYYLSRIDYDPEHTLKRLGDAYVEYRIIENQLFDLTGRSSSGDPVTAMQQLYDNAIDAQKQLGLTPGVALTPAQIASLTRDMVWMEEETVNGQQVLVPHLYLAASTLANTSLASAEIKAGQATLTSGTLTNSGAVTVNGGLRVQTAGNLLNNGGSLFSAHDIVVVAGGNVTNQSGTVTGNDVTIAASGDVANNTVAVRDTYANGFAANGFADRRQQAGAITAQGQLLVQAAGNISAEGGRFGSGSDMALVAGNNVAFSPLSLSRARNDTFKGGFDRAASTSNTLTQLNAGSDLTIVAGNDLAATAAQVTADGLLTVAAGRDIAITAGTDRSMHEQRTTASGGMILQSITTKTHDYSDTSTSVASSFTGSSVNIAAGRDLALTGSSITGEADVTVSAGRHVDLGIATDTASTIHTVDEKTSGLLGAPGGGIGFAIGTKKTHDSETGDTATTIGSLIGSTNGNVSILAGGDLTSNAGVVVAPNGDLTVVANSISMAAGRDRAANTFTHDEKFSGLAVSLGAGPNSPLAPASQATNYLNAASKTRDERARQLYGVAAIGQGLNAVTALANNGPGSLLSAQVTIGFGTQKSHYESSSYGEQATDTLVIAGKTASLIATGGDLTLQGIGINGRDVGLAAKGDVNLLSLALNANVDSSQSSSSTFAGVTLSVGAPGVLGIGLTASASGSKASSHEQDQTHAQTIVTGRNSVTIASGHDTTLKGAEVYGGKIDLTVGRDLTIVSDQETASQTASQSSWSADGSIGINTATGLYGSLSANQSKGKAGGDYKSVTTQSGLFAGDGGFNVNVGDVTTLAGAVIASTAAAENNRLNTGALVVENLTNASNWKASTKGYGFNVGSQSLGKIAGIGGLQPSLPQKEHGFSSGTAISSIAPGLINILDTEAQRRLTGMTPEQAIAAVNRAAAAQNTPASALPNIEQKLQNQADRSAAFAAASSTTATLVANYAFAQWQAAQDKIDALNKQLAANGSLTAAQQAELADAQAHLAAWQEGGSARILLHGITQGVLAGIGGGSLQAGVQGAAGATAAAALGPRITGAVQQTLNDAGLATGSSSTLGNLIGELVTAGIGAAVGNGAGAATAAGVQINNYLTHADNERRAAAKGELAACQSKPGSCSDQEIAALQQTIGDLNKKDADQQAAYVSCRASGFNGDGCGAVLTDAYAALSSYSGIASVYLDAETRAALQLSNGNLEQIVSIMAPDGVEKLGPQKTKELAFLIQLLTGDPTGLTASPALAKAAIDGDPLALLQAVGIALKISSLKIVGSLENQSGASGIADGAAQVGTKEAAIGPWADGISNVQKGATFTQCGAGSCVAATGQILTDGVITEQQLIGKIGEWSNPIQLANALNEAQSGGRWMGGYFNGADDALTIAKLGEFGAVLQAPGAAAHMVTISPVPGVAGQFLVRDTGIGASYTVSTGWIEKYVSGGVWKR